MKFIPIILMSFLLASCSLFSKKEKQVQVVESNDDENTLTTQVEETDPIYSLLARDGRSFGQSGEAVVAENDSDDEIELDEGESEGDGEAEAPEEEVEGDEFATKQASPQRNAVWQEGKNDLLKSVTYKQDYYDHWISYYTKNPKNRERFERQMKRGIKYRAVVEDIFSQYNVPKELFFIGLIESGYGTRARSHAGAVGPWQFMRGTGKQYGLIINNGIDERLSIYKATEAAAQYFSDLYNVFGRWDLALVAYNSGEYRVLRAIMKGNSRDLKTLKEKKLLPRETRHYVPKLMAAKHIFENAKKYGFDIKIEESFPILKPFTLRRSTSLQSLAQTAGISYDTLKKYNPDLRWSKVSVRSRRGIDIYLPASSLANMTGSIFNSQGPLEPAPASKRSIKTYKVKRGDNLSVIADRFDVRLSSLKRMNNLNSSRIYVGQNLKIKKMTELASDSKTEIYRVQRGDNLSNIAARFHTSVSKLQNLNGMKSARIYVGQKLKIEGDVPTQKIAHYRVKRGDNLIRLSRRFNVPVNEIKKVNGIKKNTLMANQLLKIPGQ